MTRCAALLMFGLALTQPAVSDPSQPVMTAADLQQICVAQDTTSKNVCRVYILGITQGIAIGMDIADGKSATARACIPQKLSGEELADSIKTKLAQSLAASPKDQEMDAAKFVAGVMAKTFPCRKP
ncbi:MAG: hypothetical protein JSR36_11290 [Proteobacteria bacterium]|nr:hypothetical protein [Pseudomonadota bacterium]